MLFVQGQTLFERDMKALDPAELERVKAALAGEEVKPDPKKETKKRPIARTAAGEKWVDPTLTEWPESEDLLLLRLLGACSGVSLDCFKEGVLRNAAIEEALRRLANRCNS